MLLGSCSPCAGGLTPAARPRRWSCRTLGQAHSGQACRIKQPGFCFWLDRKTADTLNTDVHGWVQPAPTLTGWPFAVCAFRHISSPVSALLAQLLSIRCFAAALRCHTSSFGPAGMLLCAGAAVWWKCGRPRRNCLTSVRCCGAMGSCFPLLGCPKLREAAYQELGLFILQPARRAPCSAYSAVSLCSACTVLCPYGNAFPSTTRHARPAS